MNLPLREVSRQWARPCRPEWFLSCPSGMITPLICSGSMPHTHQPSLPALPVLLEELALPPQVFQLTSRRTPQVLRLHSPTSNGVPSTALIPVLLAPVAHLPPSADPAPPHQAPALKLPPQAPERERLPNGDNAVALGTQGPQRVPLEVPAPIPTLGTLSASKFSTWRGRLIRWQRVRDSEEDIHYVDTRQQPCR